MLYSDLCKYLNQMEFEYAKDTKNNDLKFMDVNFFKQQFSQIAKPCQLMVDKLESQYKLCLERSIKL